MIEIAEDTRRELAAVADARVAEAVKRATLDLYRRLGQTVGRMAERLGDEKNIFRDSLVSNLSELLDLIPALNVTGDPTLERLRADAAAVFTRIDPQRSCGFGRPGENHAPRRSPGPL
ncbi:MAG: hypothetical protein HC888_19950, partial [Candidatus Competibacteraceae bacterium]|nr:hypothetical protein [Candidatus Competibacteraceae bacterium]